MSPNRVGIAGPALCGTALLLVGVGCVPLAGNSPPAELELTFNTGRAVAPAGGAEPAVFASESIFEEIPGRIGSHAPTLTAFPDGELLAAWYSYVGPHELDGAAIYTARRRAGETAWQPPALLVDRPQADGNPVLYSEGAEVWLFQAVVSAGWSSACIEVQHSADRGATWTPPTTIAGPLGANVRHPPIRTADGALLLPAYDDLWQRSLFFRSTDGGTWALAATVATPAPTQNLQPSVARLAGGRLLAVMRNAGTGWLWVTASDDDGCSWSSPRDSGFPNPGSPAVLLTLHSGNLVLVLNDDNARRTPLSITLSPDEGVTWTTPRVLADGAGQYAYPAAVQTPDGLVHVVYSHDRTHIAHITVNEAWIVAIDMTAP